MGKQIKKNLLQQMEARIAASKTCKKISFKTTKYGAKIIYLGSKGQKYTVFLRKKGSSCTCADHRFRGKTVGYCKHLYHGSTLKV